ncbi:GumC family protein [Spirosoma utsteinense]|uniref:Capsular exopolysaccharide synthesis family protein n=1 Tax=Spirosoma utsteinense TaxID=2585773 RepID=A0ABR6WEQ9_9BACT|nr:tyrosine-protein kinase family protein [Spirosoma utsteinense]MBC3789117.1 capsular exopolysaccharide synthesis family protein [Spirosoma utsteinense]MBC3795017.1 capsular exopolysaccharide synthesis family protein [Spirosoma utsteinense]
MVTNPYTPYQAYEVEPELNLRAMLMRYVRNWPWFVLSLLLALGAAYVYLLYQPPGYRVKASLLIKDEKKGMGGESMMKELDLFTPSKVVENEIEILKSFTIMDRVVTNLGLNVRYYIPTSTVKKEIYGKSPIRLLVEKPAELMPDDALEIAFVDARTVTLNGEAYPVNQSIQTPYGQLRILTRKPLSAKLEPMLVTMGDHIETAEGYLNNLTVEPMTKQATVLMMSLDEAVPDKGVAILNQIINEYNKEAVIDKNREAGNTLSFIENRLGLISGELATVEKEVERYKSTQGITDLSVQAQTFLTTVKDNDSQLNEVNIRLGALGDVERYLQHQGGEQGLAPATLGLSDPVLTGLLAKVSELELKREEVSRTISPNNPLVQSLDSQLKTLKANINENVQTIRQQLTSNRAQLVTNNQRMEGMIRTVPGKERALLNITRQQAIKNGLYTYLLQKREETALSAASAIPDSRTVDAARAGSKPVKPVKMMVFGIFTLLGLLIPIGFLTAKDALNNRVLHRADVEDVTQVPILGEVVRSRQLTADNLVFKPRMQSVIGEQIRTLRTNLHFLRSDPDTPQVVLFTSSISGEGKSFISLNLGASLAMVDNRTVILEMDMRKPKLHQSLHMENNRGLSNYLIGEATLDELLQPIPGYENYFIITAGPLPPNPAELLSSPRLGKLFAELKERFDYVLVDSPPVGLVTDSQLIAPHADATLFLVRHDHTPKNSIKMVDVMFKEQRFQRLSIILNGVGEGESYYYNYSYGDYYGGSGKKNWLTKGNN